MKAAVLTVLVVSLCILSVHAEKSSIGTFLLTAEKDYSVAEQEKKVSFLQESSKNMPVIDDIELRIRNRAYRFDRQRYSLRVEPRGFGETRASRNVYQTLLHYNKHKKNVLLNEKLSERCFLVIELLYHQMMLVLYKRLSVLYEDRISVLKKQTGSLDFDLNDIIKSENKLTKLRLEIVNLEKNEHLIKEGYIPLLRRKIIIGDTSDKFDTFDTTGFVTVEYISEQVKNTGFNLDSNNVYLQHDKLELQFAENRYNLEVAEGRRYISFFEFAYDHGERMEELAEKNDNDPYDLKRAFIMNLGIRIPYINSDRHDINRRKLEYLSDKENYTELKRELEYRVNKDSDDIRTLVEQYAFLKARKENVNAESSLKRYLEMEGVDPLVLLSLKESIIDNDINMEEIKFNILRNYIRILDVTGQLSRKPIKNYLSLKQEAVAK